MSKKLTKSWPRHRLRRKTAPPRIGGLPGKRGKAHGMGADLWAQWLEHVARCGPCWLHVLLFLTHSLCLRVTEALCLRAEDFDFEGHVVNVSELKKQPAVAKPILQSLLPMMESLRANGVSVERSRNQGARGFVHCVDTWSFPEKGLLFKAERSDSNSARRQRSAVIKAVSRARRDPIFLLRV